MRVMTKNDTDKSNEAKKKCDQKSRNMFTKISRTIHDLAGFIQTDLSESGSEIL